MVEVDGLVSSSQVSQCSSNLVHEQVISRIEIESLIEEIDGDVVLPLDKEQDGHCTIDIGIIQTQVDSMFKHMDQV
jgi:hypothetical protein